MPRVVSPEQLRKAESPMLATWYPSAVLATIRLISAVWPMNADAPMLVTGYPPSTSGMKMSTSAPVYPVISAVTGAVPMRRYQNPFSTPSARAEGTGANPPVHSDSTKHTATTTDRSFLTLHPPPGSFASIEDDGDARGLAPTDTGLTRAHRSYSVASHPCRPPPSVRRSVLPFTCHGYYERV
jgi:hypothetical protein